MKKIIALLLALSVMTAVCACGKKPSTEKEGKKTETTTSVEEGKYVFKSDKKQKVFKSGNNYLIFYFEDKEIKDIDTVMTFSNDEAAQASLEVLKKVEDKKYGEMVREGKFVVIHMTDAYIQDYKKMDEAGLESFLKAQGYILVEKVGDETTTVKAEGKTTAKSDAKATTAAAKTTAAQKTTAAAKTTAAPNK